MLVCKRDKQASNLETLILSNSSNERNAEFPPSFVFVVSNDEVFCHCSRSASEMAPFQAQPKVQLQTTMEG